MDKGQLFVLSGPSGSGKDTVLSKVLERCPGMRMSISCITREQRREDLEGKNKYRFVSKADFLSMLEQGELLEYNEYLSNYYGTPKTPVLEALAQGTDMVLEVDVNGAASVRGAMTDVVSIFIMPPSLEVLRQRLIHRGDSAEDVEKRVVKAKEEIRRAGEFDYIVLNDRLDDAVDTVTAIVTAARARAKRNESFISEVLKLC